MLDLPPRHRVRRRRVAAEDGELLGEDQLDVAAAAVDHRADAAARAERDRRELAEVRGRRALVVCLVDDDVVRRHLAEHRQDPADRCVAVELHARNALDGEGGSRESRAFAERQEVRRERPAAFAELVENVGDRPRVQPRRTLGECVPIAVGAGLTCASDAAGTACSPLFCSP